MNYSAKASLIIAAAVSGIFRQMLPFTKETNINMNIVGERASGKSTICHFALSVFGNPEILEGSFTDTENAMEIIRAERTVIPYIMDERMLKVEGSTERTKKKMLLLDIFREYEGKVKERAGKQYEEMSGKRTYSPIISSSVESMLGLIYDYGDLGQFRRFIEINIENETELFASAQEAEQTEETAYVDYGHGIDIIINYIFDNGLEDRKRINEMFDELNQVIRKHLEDAEKRYNVKGLHSSSKRFALIILSYIMLHKALSAYIDEISGSGNSTNNNKTSAKGLQQPGLEAMSGNSTDNNNETSAKELQQPELEAMSGNSTDNNNETSASVAADIFNDRTSEILDTLTNNIIEKMKRVKLSINVKKNIYDFIKKHRNMFNTESSAWDGDGEWLGHLSEKDGVYTMEMRKNSNIGWLLVSPVQHSDDELLEYVRICIKNKYGVKNKEMH